MDEKWGKYLLKRLIAQGGMADIFEASMVGPSGFIKPVCLKRIRVEFSKNPEFVQMFESEARIVATLHHPNIVQVFDFDRHEGQLFLAMELMDGLDLRRILKEASRRGLRVPIEFAVHVMKGLLAALAHAHGQTVDGTLRPVIHRDVSPHNILVSNYGVVKLTDFGIAKAKGLSDVTRVGVVKGKIAYISPEQARGEAAEPRSDLFSAGLVLWEMLEGRRFYQANDDRGVMAQMLSRSFSPIQGISPELNNVLGRMLAHELSDRSGSAEEALVALDEVEVSGHGAVVVGQVVNGIVRDSEVDSPQSTRISDEVEQPELGQTGKRSVLIAALVVLGLSVILFFVFRAGGLGESSLGDPEAIEPLQLTDEPPRVVKPSAMPEQESSQTAESNVDSEEVLASPQSTFRTGLLQINVRPWARVKIDGVDRGTTPLNELRLRAGSHRVVLVNKELGYRHVVKVQVRPKKKSVINEVIPP